MGSMETYGDGTNQLHGIQETLDRIEGLLGRMLETAKPVGCQHKSTRETVASGALTCLDCGAHLN